MPCMERRIRWAFWLKVLLLLIVLIGVGLFFAHVLTSAELQATDRSRSPGQILWHQFTSARPLDLAASAGLYLLGLAFPALFWLLLLHKSGEPLPWLTAFRAYYLSHLGKYAPLGKGFALLVRVTLSSSAGVRAGTAAVTGAYETLTMMAAGALLAVVVVVWQVEAAEGLFWRALGLLALAGIPLLPGVFNRLIKPLAGRFLSSASWPKPGVGVLLLGLLLMGLCWTLLGASLALVIQALQPERLASPLTEVFRYTAYVAVSYVAGFVAATPGGLGVRELFLQQMLAPQLGLRAILVVLLVRVLWTVAELLMAALLYLVPVQPVPGERRGVSPPVEAEHRRAYAAPLACEKPDS